MITHKQVAVAINQRLKDTLPDIRINTADIKESFTRPSLYVDFDNVIPSKFGTNGFERTISVIIYFFPTDKTQYKMEVLDVQQKLELAFINNLTILDGFVVYPSDLSSAKVDGILQFSFDIRLVEAGEEETGDMIEELEINV